MPKGLLGDETGHFLDKVIHGIDDQRIVVRAWLIDQGRLDDLAKLGMTDDSLGSFSMTDIRKHLGEVVYDRIDRWHHRRMFGRIMYWIDESVQHPLMTLVTGGNSKAWCLAWRDIATGAKVQPPWSWASFLDKIYEGWFDGPFEVLDVRYVQRLCRSSMSIV